MESAQKYIEESIKLLTTNSLVVNGLINTIQILKETLTFDKKVELIKLQTQIQRATKDYKQGLSSYENFNTIINQKENVLIDFITNLKDYEIIRYFTYDDSKGEVLYQFFNFKDELIYQYKGDLIKGQPNGKGELLYLDGNLFRGNFKDGLKSGEGKYYDINCNLIKSGIWQNDEFIENGFKFYSSIKVAASQNKGTINSYTDDFEIHTLPKIKEQGLIAFTVEGDSMEPKYYEGDVVICKEIKDFNKLINNRTYIIFYYDERTLEEKAYLKTVQLTNEISKKITLISINFEEHPPFDIYPNSLVLRYKSKILN